MSYLKRLRHWFIHKLGGYTSEDRNEVLTLAVAKMFNTIGPDDILKETPEGWTFQGKLMTQAGITDLQAHIKHLEESKLWKIVKADVKYEANKAMFEKSRDIVDLTAGKLMLYVLDVIDTRFKQIKNTNASG